MKRRISVLALVTAGALAFACSGTDAKRGFSEPVRVKNGQFLAGDLPGTPPGTPGPGDLRVTNLSSANRVIQPGQAGKKIDGRASARASAIGIRFADVGSGYWVFPLGAPDPQFPGELTWDAELDMALSASDAPGFHGLRAVAIDESGAAGEQVEVPFCFASRIPDNGASCDPKQAVPEAVITLLWDADMDLDLRAVLPSGRAVDPKHPLTDPAADGGAASPDVGSFDRDSIAGCTPDGRRQESLVFPKRPHGNVDLYVALFAACGKQAASFDLVISEIDTTGPTPRLTERARTRGRIGFAASQSESEQPPLYVTSYAFP